MPTRPTPRATSPPCVTALAQARRRAGARRSLTSLSGQNYSGFSNSMVQGAQLFMSNFADAGRRRQSPAAARVALAEACDVACDAQRDRRSGAPGAARWAGWARSGQRPSSGSVTYNVGGFAGRPRPQARRQLLRRHDRGLHHRQPMGRRASTARAFPTPSRPASTAATRRARSMLDGIAGYAYSANQLWRAASSSPAWQRAPPHGQTGANQFYGQLEGGYRVDHRRPGGSLRHAVRPPAGLHRHAERLHRDRRAVAQPHRRRARRRTRCAP